MLIIFSFYVICGKNSVMKINVNEEILAGEVNMEGAKDVRMKILVGPRDGSENIILRHFIIAPGGNTPYHKHNYEHLVKIEKNKGIAVDKDGKEFEVKAGHSLYVVPNEMHQFRNPFNEDFEFLCIIPNPERQ
jgi:quercetin dioxygenase-like cupin family protein